jgi:putative Mn2+ efflux pump MntP
MDLLTPSLVGIGLSMDSFTVSLAFGSTIRARLFITAVTVALCFGVFQAGMTLLGWGAGVSVIMLISAYDHWVAFILLAIVGGKMVWGGEDQEEPVESIRFYTLIVLSIATSIDALAVGVSFGVLQTAILLPAFIIGIVCFGISFAGVMLGKRLEKVLGNKMDILGGFILILIGVKILYEHMIG